MNDARAVAHGYIAVADDIVCLEGRVCRRDALYLGGGFGEQRLIFQTFPLLAELSVYYLILLEMPADERLRKDIAHSVGLNDDIVFVGIHAERDVRRQRPGSGRPRENVQVILTLYLKARNYRVFLYRLVALRNLVRGQRRAATGAIGNYLVTLIEKPLLVHLLERPPLGLYILVIVGDVGVVHIDPVADAVAHLFPLALVLPYRLLTLLDERLYAVALYLGLAVYAERLFDLEFDGQTVRIPAGLSQYVIALHCAVTGDYVLHYAR